MSFVRGQKDFYAGVLFIAVGIFTIAVAANYPMGTAARMGPGYFPRALGSLLVILGFFSTLRGLRKPGEPVARWFLRPFLTLVVVVIFGHIVDKIGMALSTVFLVVGASAASPEFRPKEAFISGVLLAIACVLVFIYGLGITLPVWPDFR
ncbi:MAG TPA: tripartite tricarboxylate transporter TctB family protein [Casimicrobiaceae bacterium]|nr:tripartite tricarboxylate transporter TctB family protein [Casimicrobiaceae bacterium]